MISEILPESTKELAGVIGLTEALALVTLRGGVRMAVPSRYNEDHWLVEAIRQEPAQKLIAYYRGDTVEVSTCHNLYKVIRNIDIVNDATQGLSHAQLALKYGMTDRGIRKILARSKL